MMTGEEVRGPWVTSSRCSPNYHLRLSVGCRRMSALGQKQTFGPRKSMSALPPKVDIVERDRHVRFVPKADIVHRAALRVHGYCFA